MKKFALYINTGGGCSGGILAHKDTREYIDSVDMYDFTGEELINYDVLLIGTDADQKYLLKKKPFLDAFLNSGKTVIFCGALAYPFLDGVGKFEKMYYGSYLDYSVTPVAEHPIWSDVQPKDMMMRRGVAGFYARGFNPPPANAVILNTLGSAKHPIDYEYTTVGGGRVVVHSGNNLWLFIDDATTAAKMGTNLIEWLKKEVVA